jgi:hypothetical protein
VIFFGYIDTGNLWTRAPSSQTLAAAAATISASNKMDDRKRTAGDAG